MRSFELLHKTILHEPFKTGSTYAFRLLSPTPFRKSTEITREVLATKALKFCQKGIPLSQFNYNETQTKKVSILHSIMLVVAFIILLPPCMSGSNEITPTFISIDQINKSSKSKYSCSDSLLNEHMQSKWSESGNSIITNLNKYMSPFSDGNCLVILDNFQNTNVMIDNNPLIVRQPVPLCRFREDAKSDKYKDSIWGPGSLFVDKSFVTSNSEIICPASKFLNGNGILRSNSLPDACLRLNLRKYWKHVKPWNCAVHIVPYPSIYMSEEFGELWPTPFNVEESRRLYSFSYSLSVPQVHILVEMCPDDKCSINSMHWHWIFESLYPKGMDASREVQATTVHIEDYVNQHRRRDIFSQDVFIIMETSAKQATHELASNVTENSRSIVHTYVLQFTFGNWQETNTWTDLNQAISKKLITFPAEVIDKASLDKLTLQSSVENTIWSFHENFEESDDNIYHGIYKNLQTCDNFKSNAGMLSLEGSNEEMFRKEFTKIWLSVMNNYTIILKEKYRDLRICLNNREVLIPSPNGRSFAKTASALSIGLQSVPYMNLYYFTSHFPTKDVNNNFRIVSCGTRTISSLRFDELVNIFDQWVWLAIAVTIISLSVVLTMWMKYTTGGNLLNYFLSHSKVLLEQGDPYNEGLFGTTSLRCLIGSYLIAGIVLSNAYKNSNVYNLITPRKPLPFETFSELRTANFTIFSRMGDEYVRKRFEHLSSNTFLMKRALAGSAVFLAEASDYQIFARTELAKFYDMGTFPNQKLSDLVHFVRRNPTLFNWVKTIFEGIAKAPLPGFQYIVNQMAIFRTREMNYFFDLMLKCEKIALVLPSGLCSRVAQKVKHSKHYLPVSIGKDTYFGMNGLITLTGFVPHRIVTRLKAIGESGIWDWLMQVATGKSNSHSLEGGSSPFQAGNMRGNLIILFYVLVGGLGVSTVVFIIQEILLTCVVSKIFLPIANHIMSVHNI